MCFCRDLYSAIRQVGLDQVLSDTYRKWTFFAPTNEAFVMMREGAVGRDFLDDTATMREVGVTYYVDICSF